MYYESATKCAYNIKDIKHYSFEPISWAVMADEGCKWNNYPLAWWRHQMEILSALLAICSGNSPVTGEFPV